MKRMSLPQDSMCEHGSCECSVHENTCTLIRAMSQSRKPGHMLMSCLLMLVQSLPYPTATISLSYYYHPYPHHYPTKSLLFSTLSPPYATVPLLQSTVLLDTVTTRPARTSNRAKCITVTAPLFYVSIFTHYSTALLRRLRCNWSHSH